MIIIIMLLYYPCVLSHVAVLPLCPVPCCCTTLVSCPKLLYYPCILSVLPLCPVPCCCTTLVSCLYYPCVPSHVAVLQANGHRRRGEQTTLGSNPGETGQKLQLQNSTEPNKNNQNKAPPHHPHKGTTTTTTTTTTTASNQGHRQQPSRDGDGRSEHTYSFTCCSFFAV